MDKQSLEVILQGLEVMFIVIEIIIISYDVFKNKKK